LLFYLKIIENESTFISKWLKMNLPNNPLTSKSSCLAHYPYLGHKAHLIVMQQQRTQTRVIDNLEINLKIKPSHNILIYINQAFNNRRPSNLNIIRYVRFNPKPIVNPNLNTTSLSLSINNNHIASIELSLLLNITMYNHD